MDTDFYVQLPDQVADGVCFVDTDRRITFWNHGAERITGYAAKKSWDTVALKGFCGMSTTTGRSYVCMDVRSQPS